MHSFEMRLSEEGLAQENNENADPNCNKDSPINSVKSGLLLCATSERKKQAEYASYIEARVPVHWVRNLAKERGEDSAFLNAVGKSVLHEADGRCSTLKTVPQEKVTAVAVEASKPTSDKSELSNTEEKCLGGCVPSDAGPGVGGLSMAHNVPNLFASATGEGGGANTIFPRALATKKKFPFHSKLGLARKLSNENQTHETSPQKACVSTVFPAAEQHLDGPKLQESQSYEKYRKMLKMGVPPGAVKNAVQRDGLDPSFMDVECKKPSDGQKTASIGSQDQSTRRKTIHFTEINCQKISKGSIWHSGKDRPCYDRLNKHEIERLFTESTKQCKAGSTMAKGRASTQQARKTSVIDPRRSMNGDIELAKAKVDLGCLVQMIDRMECIDFSGVPLMTLQKYLPTKKEQIALKKITPVDKVGNCEKYMLEVMKINMADTKLRCMACKSDFGMELNEVVSGVELLKKACKEVKKSSLFKELLGMLLDLLNCINNDGLRKDAQGFTFDTLAKIDETKAFDKKTSVLQYFAKCVKEKSPNLVKVCEEMPSVGLAQDVTIEHLQSKIEKMTSELTAVKEMAKTIAEKGQASTKHVTQDDKSSDQTEMEEFAVSALQQTAIVSKDTQHAAKCFEDILGYTAQDLSMSTKIFLGAYMSFCLNSLQK